MENIYDSYIKVIQDKTYYFVKKYLHFPEYDNVADVMEGYGMHTDFNIACSIAGITDPIVKKQILDDMEKNTASAKIIEFNKADFGSKSITG